MKIKCLRNGLYSLNCPKPFSKGFHPPPPPSWQKPIWTALIAGRGFPKRGSWNFQPNQAHLLNPGYRLSQLPLKRSTVLVTDWASTPSLPSFLLKLTTFCMINIVRTVHFQNMVRVLMDEYFRGRKCINNRVFPLLIPGGLRGLSDMSRPRWCHTNAHCSHVKIKLEVLAHTGYFFLLVPPQKVIQAMQQQDIKF